MIEEVFERIEGDLQWEQEDSKAVSKQLDKILSLSRELRRDLPQNLSEKIMEFDRAYMDFGAIWRDEGRQEGFCKGFQFAVKLLFGCADDKLFRVEE